MYHGLVGGKQIVESHEWPSAVAEDTEGSVPEDKTSQWVRFLLPPDSIVNTLKDGLKVKDFLFLGCSGVLLVDLWF